MSDTFMKSFNQGLNLAHTIEQDKRLQQAAQMQQMVQMMQLQKMAQEMAADQHIQGDPSMRTAISSQFEDPAAAETAMKGGVPFSKLKTVMPIKQNRQPMTFENLLVEQVRSGKMTLQDAMKAKQANKEFNIPAEVDTFLMTRFPNYSSDPNVRSEAANWISSPAGRKEYDAWWSTRKQTGPTVVTYVPTSEGIVPMPTRGGGFPPTGKPIEGPSGPLGKPLPAGEMGKLSDLEVLLKNVDVARSNFDKEYVGPVAGRVGSMKEQVVDIPEKQVTFYAAVRDAKDALLRARSGAQINEQEYQRLVKFLPDENLPPANFIARLNRFEKELQTTITVKRSTLKSGGYGTGEQPKKTQQKTPVKRGVYNGKAVIQYSDGSIEYAEPN